MNETRKPYYELEQIVVQYIEEKGILLPRGVTHAHFFHALDHLVRKQPRYGAGTLVSHTYERTDALTTHGALVIDRELPLVGREHELFGTMQVFGICPVGDEYHIVSRFHGIQNGKLHSFWMCEPQGFVGQVIERLDHHFGVVEAKKAYVAPVPQPRIAAEVPQASRSGGVAYLLRNMGVRTLRLFQG